MRVVPGAYASGTIRVSCSVDIDIKNIIALQKELNVYADNILNCRRMLAQYQENMNMAWNGQEMDWVNRSLDGMLYRMKQLSKEMEDIGQDLLSVYLYNTEENE